MLPGNVMEIMASPSSLFSAYASFSGSMMLVRTMVNDIIPRPVQAYLWQAIRRLFKANPPVQEHLTLVVEEYFHGQNEIFDAAEIYLRITEKNRAEFGSTGAARSWRSSSDEGVLVSFAKDETILDTFDGVELKWKFVTVTTRRQRPNYLGIPDTDDENHCHRRVFTEIKSLLAKTQVTPAEVAEELTKSEDPHVALDGLVKLLKQKKRETPTDGKLETVEEIEDQLKEKLKIE
ncbi:hypothetical protein CRG98_032514 [Punica granatum]|uniref:Uncharacterized protein n=1 Tax=Punica granatum TaxID=22663 RepID=A0A2I0ISW7_PUNGR|nr:hypothetical protein CRG98_032514 [Punica granatum]